MLSDCLAMKQAEEEAFKDDEGSANRHQKSMDNYMSADEAKKWPTACENYAYFHNRDPKSVSVNEVLESNEGLDGW